MISIFPSERMGPAQGPPAAGPKPASEQNTPSGSSAFASMMSKGDQAPPEDVQRIPQSNEASKPSLTSSEIVLPDPDVAVARLPETQPDADAADALALPAPSDPAVAPDADAADALALPPPSDPAVAPDAEAALAEVETAPVDSGTRPIPDRVARIAAAQSAPNAASEINTEFESNRPASESSRTAQGTPPSTDAAPDRTVTAKPEKTVAPDIQTDAPAHSDVPAKATTATHENTPRPTRLDLFQASGDEPLRIQRGQDAAEPPMTEIKDAVMRGVSDVSAGADKLTLAGLKTAAVNLTTDAPLTFADSVVTAAQVQSASSQTVPTGMIPTQPAVQIAAPNDITAIILNNIRNIADPQEQLIIQLDPPELGRVSIDFKFDAQGVQQITVTTENPEALKRLRELHFELTNALRDHGLSEKNMSFRQHSDGQSRSPWQSASPFSESGHQGQIADPVRSTPVLPTRPGLSSNNRLDLTL